MDLEPYLKSEPGGRKYYHQLLVLQDNLFTRAMNEEKDNAKAAACARSWEVLEERKRIMRGKLKAGSYNAHSKDFPNKSKSKRVTSGSSVSHSKPSSALSHTTTSVSSEPEITLEPQASQETNATQDTPQVK